jgi:hypothetical protein
MVTKCDICGFPIVGQQNYCGGCGLDLREQRGEKKREIRSPEMKSPSYPRKEKEDENPFSVIKWCWLKWGELPHVLVMIALLAKGKSKLGFCGCAACNQGYREWLAFSNDPDGERQLKASSREIVVKAREDDFTKITLDVAHLINTTGSKERDGTNQASPIAISPVIRSGEGKIFIELDESVIERAVLNVLSSEQGQNIIKTARVPKKRKVKEKAE